MEATTQVKERPILFSGAMIRALLDGKKTQTRRILKKALFPGDEWAGAVYPARERGWIAWSPGKDTGLVEFTKKAYREGFPCPYGVAGDRLWARESWRIDWTPGCGHGIWYAADQQFVCWDTPARDGYQWLVEHYGNNNHTERLRPSIHMPRWASRITLEITGVRVERLQSITEEDAYAQGIPEWKSSEQTFNPVVRFHELWDKINPKHPWSENPYVWVVSFKRVTE